MQDVVYAIISSMCQCVHGKVKYKGFLLQWWWYRLLIHNTFLLLLNITPQ